MNRPPDTPGTAFWTRITQSVSARPRRAPHLLGQRLAQVALLVACVAPGAILSAASQQSPWNLSRIARAAISLQEGRIATFVTSLSGYRGEHIGGEMMLAALIQATGWALDSLGTLPIGSLLLALVTYALARETSRSRWTAAGITLFASWYYPRLFSQFADFYPVVLVYFELSSSDFDYCKHVVSFRK